MTGIFRAVKAWRHNIYHGFEAPTLFASTPAILPASLHNAPAMADAVVANVEYSSKEDVNYTMVRQ